MKKQTLSSIIEKGGATLNARGRQVSYLKGYQVSFKDLYKIKLEKFDDILQKVNKALNDAQGDCVGLWVDSGFIYIDYSKKIDDLQEALTFGKLNNQLSIFDWASKKCIFLAEV